VCASDPNAGARAAAQQQINEKNYKYGANSVKYWNRETSYKRGRERAAMGLSKTQSDTYQQAINAIGKSRAYEQSIAAAQAAGTKGAAAYGMGESGDRKKARMEALQFLAKRATVDAQMRELPKQQDSAHHASKLKYLAINAKNLENLGMKPDWGAPVMMPPRDTTGQILGTVMNTLSIASAGLTLGGSLAAGAAGAAAGGGLGGFFSGIGKHAIGKNPTKAWDYEY
tara:strand:- start:124 stop:804 length:681 start_codon:yes stop_codon:yes gene_type:complete